VLPQETILRDKRYFCCYKSLTDVAAPHIGLLVRKLVYYPYYSKQHNT